MCRGHDIRFIFSKYVVSTETSRNVASPATTHNACPVVILFQGIVGRQVYPPRISWTQLQVIAASAGE